MSPTSPTTRPLNPRHAAAALLVALSLTGLSACSVSIGGGSTGQDAATASRKTTPSTPSEQSAATSQPAATTTKDSQTPRSEPTASGTQQQSAPAASAGAGVPGTGAQPATGDRPGAQVTITDSEWLSDLESVDRTISATPTMLLDKANDDVRIEGDVESLSVSASNARVFVDYVGLLTISGGNVTVYVKDVDRVVVKGTNVEVVWAGNPPKVEDFGHNTETRQQGAKSS